MPKHVDWYNDAGEHFCSGCQAYMDMALFHQSRARPDGLSEYCRLCRREQRRAYYARHRAREIATARIWQAAHPEQTRVTQRRAYRVYTLRKRLERETARIADAERSA